MTRRFFKFRAWNNSKCEWVDHNEFLNEPEVSATVLLPSIFEFTHDDWVIQQFTGLIDKNGKEIFEGDVIKYRRFGKNEYALAEVTFSDAAFYADYMLSDLMVFSVFETEIIGNVFENPNLLGDRHGN